MPNMNIDFGAAYEQARGVLDQPRANGVSIETYIRYQNVLALTNGTIRPILEELVRSGRGDRYINTILDTIEADVNRLGQERAVGDWAVLPSDPIIPTVPQVAEQVEERETRPCGRCGLTRPASELCRTDRGGLICKGCVRTAPYIMCECGNYTKKSSDRLVLPEDGGEEKYMCRRCVERLFNHGYGRCNVCARVTPESREADRRRLFWGVTSICELCADTHQFCGAEDCGNIVNTEHWDMEAHMTDDGVCLCENCWELKHAAIHEYNYKPSMNFLGGKPDQGYHFYGVELEADGENEDVNYKAVARAVKELSNDEQLFYNKSDGSLLCGFEVVSHPATLEYHMNEFPWDAITKTLRREGMRSHGTDTCGLHIHASRTMFGDSQLEQDLTIAKVMLLFDNNWDKIVRFSRREYDKLNEWARKPNVQIEKSDNEMVCRMKSKCCEDEKYKAINLRHRSTVEFRVFRGTLKVSTILATLQWVDTIISYAKETGIEEIWDVSWDDIFSGTQYPELRAYMQDKSLLEGDE